jgi:hypothetical protein
MDCIGLEKLELELREEIEEIKRATNKQIMDLQDENTKTSEQVKFLVEKLDMSEKNNMELQDALSQMSADKAKVEVDTMDKINDLEEELRSLKEKYALLDQEFTEVQQSDKNNRYKLDNLSAEFAKVSEERLAFQIECEANRNFTEQLEVRLEEASQRVAQEEEELRQKEEEVNKLQAKVKTLGEIERRKSIKTSETSSKISQLTLENKRLSEELKKMVATHKQNVAETPKIMSKLSPMSRIAGTGDQRLEPWSPHLDLIKMVGSMAQTASTGGQLSSRSGNGAHPDENNGLRILDSERHSYKDNPYHRSDTTDKRMQISPIFKKPAEAAPTLAQSTPTVLVQPAQSKTQENLTPLPVPMEDSFDGKTNLVAKQQPKERRRSCLGQTWHLFKFFPLGLFVSLAFYLFYMLGLYDPDAKKYPKIIVERSSTDTTSQQTTRQETFQTHPEVQRLRLFGDKDKKSQK